MPSGRHNRTKYAKDRNHPLANPAWRTDLDEETEPYVGPTETKVNAPEASSSEQSS